MEKLDIIMELPRGRLGNIQSIKIGELASPSASGRKGFSGCASLPGSLFYCPVRESITAIQARSAKRASTSNLSVDGVMIAYVDENDLLKFKIEIHCDSI